MGTGRRSTTRVGVWLMLAAAMGAALAVTAYAVTTGNRKPPDEPLAVAIHQAAAGKPVEALRADFSVSQRLLPGSSSLLSSSSLAGASGRIWVSGDQMRLAMQSRLGAAEVQFDGERATLYVPRAKIAYRLTVPRASEPKTASDPPSVADIQQTLSRLGQILNISGAIPGNLADRPAYTVRLSARGSSGLIGPLELAWDAEHGTPLRVALYPRGSAQPAISLEVNDISYGSVSSSATTLSLPAGTTVMNFPVPGASELHRMVDGAQKHVESGPAGESSGAPAVAAGLPRTFARSISTPKGGGVVAVYGQGLGAVVVVERRTGGDVSANEQLGGLPAVRIGDANGTELETTLGTIVTFQRAARQYVVLGAQPASTVLAVARALP